MSVTFISDPVDEQTTRAYAVRILDEDDTGVPSDQIGTLTLTLYNRDSGTIINERDHISIKNANGGTIDTEGNLGFLFTPEDNAIENNGLLYETRVALIEWTYGPGGARHGKHELVYRVRNLGQVETPEEEE